MSKPDVQNPIQNPKPAEFNSDLAIKVENLTKIYPLYKKPLDRMKEALHPFRKKYHFDFYALDNVSFEINKGDTIGIIGRNGAGKSTLLKILTGVLTPTSGRILVNGKVSSLLELGTGFNPELTGIENIYFNGTVNGIFRKEIDKKVDDIIAFADIGEFINQPVKTYSSGMFARLAFAVAVNVEPDILIVDEVLSVGDALFQQKCMRRMNKFRDSGGTMLFVSHDIGSVVALCKKSIWLTKGVVNYYGSAKVASELYLEDYYLQDDEPRKFNSNSSASNEKEKHFVINDPRAEIINKSNARNEMKIFRFDPNTPSFGHRSIEVTNVEILDSNDHKLNFISGGEIIKIKVTMKSYEDVSRIISGFQVKDKLGQFLFGDNTYLTYRNNPVNISRNSIFSSVFNFQMPSLPRGTYSLCIGIAEGTQENHVQHHFLHEALIFESVNENSNVFGLFGIPMIDIKFVLNDIESSSAP